MADSEPSDVEVTEVPQAPTESTEPLKGKMSDARRAALEKARAKAMAVRAENAQLKRKEKEVERALAAQAKAERLQKVEEQYQKLTGVTEEPQEDADEAPPPRKRKPARRVVHVTEVSSASESETEEVEVRLPRPKKEKKTAEQLQYERAVNKLFTYE